MHSVGDLKKRLEQFKILGRVLDEDEEGLIAGTILLSYHHWASDDLTPSVILTSYLALRLKRCVVPSISRECLTLKNIYPTILLASGRSVNLLLAIVCRIHRGLRASTSILLEGITQVLGLKCHMPI